MRLSFALMLGNGVVFARAQGSFAPLSRTSRQVFDHVDHFEIEIVLDWVPPHKDSLNFDNRNVCWCAVFELSRM